MFHKVEFKQTQWIFLERLTLKRIMYAESHLVKSYLPFNCIWSISSLKPGKPHYHKTGKFTSMYMHKILSKRVPSPPQTLFLPPVMSRSYTHPSKMLTGYTQVGVMFRMQKYWDPLQNSSALLKLILSSVRSQTYSSGKLTLTNTSLAQSTWAVKHFLIKLTLAPSYIKQKKQ